MARSTFPWYSVVPRSSVNVSVGFRSVSTVTLRHQLENSLRPSGEREREGRESNKCKSLKYTTNRENINCIKYLSILNLNIVRGETGTEKRDKVTFTCKSIAE